MGAQIVFDGDSITVGDHPWHNPAWRTIERLHRAGYAIDRVRNLAVSGQTVANMQSDAVAQVDALYSGSYSANVLCVFGGTNDIRTSGGASAATLITRISTYCGDRQAAGWSVMVSTLLPCSDAGAGAGFETARGTVNASIVANYASYADALANIGANATIGDAGDSNNKDYYSDLLHPNMNGWDIIAGIWAPLIAGLL